MKAISILGSTGSIGTQTLDIINQHKDNFNVIGLTTNTNIELLENQVRQFNPLAVAVMNKEKADELKAKVDCEVYSGLEGIKKIASLNETTTVVNALVGSVGVKPTLEAIKNNKSIALANKETLVTAGELVMDLAKKHNVTIMPIDSEHSALFQCIVGEDKNTINKVILTCSGGPFRGKTKQELENVSLKEALAHPNWNMGGKITIDSATLMNKGFEVLEAMWLYNLPLEKIDVVIHPQSIVHSMVEYVDGSTMAQLSPPDMRLPILFALSHPKRLKTTLPRLDFSKHRELTFEEPDNTTFPCLQYAYDAGRIGGTLPAVLNAANEIAVATFLDNRCSFVQIPETIKAVMDTHPTIKNPTLEDIKEADSWARRKAQELLK